MESELKKENKILNEENIIFEYEDRLTGIESIFTFKDGDLLIFKNSNNSILFDGKTFLQKLELSFLGALCAFCYLNEEEFIVIKDFYFSLYKFENNRKNCKQIATIHKNEFQELNKKIFCLSNNDLINVCEINFDPIIKIFRRISENNQFKEYQLINNDKVKDIDEVINLENDQFLTIKKFQNNDTILFKVYNNKNYDLLRTNKIQCTVEGKRKIFFFDSPFFKIRKKKLLYGSIYFLYIFCIDTLEFETTIKISPEIKAIRILRDNTIILFEHSNELIGLKTLENYYISKTCIDFDNNDLIKKESEEITQKIGEFKTLFSIYNYMDNGLATITDQSQLKIFKKIGE